MSVKGSEKTKNEPYGSVCLSARRFNTTRFMLHKWLQEGKPPKPEKREAVAAAWKQEDILGAINYKFRDMAFEVCFSIIHQGGTCGGAQSMPVLILQTRKDVATCFDTLARSDIGRFSSEYLPERSSIIADLSLK